MTSRRDNINIRGFGAPTLAPALRLPGDYGPWRWGTNQQETVAGLSGHSLLTLFPFIARSAARNGRKSLTGAPGAEGRVLQWSCHKWSSEGRDSAPEDGTKASERSFSGANWL